MPEKGEDVFFVIIGMSCLALRDHMAALTPLPGTLLFAKEVVHLHQGPLDLASGGWDAAR